jgi:hypothetical protein
MVDDVKEVNLSTDVTYIDWMMMDRLYIKRMTYSRFYLYMF